MGLHLVPNNLSIDFVGRRKILYIISLIFCLACAGYLSLSGGLKFGIDFAGGTIAQIRFEKPVDSEAVKESLAPLSLPGLVVQRFGDDGQSYLVRVSSTEMGSTELRAAFGEALAALGDNPVDIQRIESVGPKVGADLRAKAVEALYLATLLIAIYISWRFEHRWFTAASMAGGLAGSMYLLELAGVPKSVLVFVATGVMVFLCWRLKLIYALGAVISILHDIIITVGIFALMGKEFDLTIIAALLTIVGYSLNDTIIVYDRIRENLQSRKSGSLAEVINQSINQTLSRTVLTSLTTQIVVASLLFLGGGMIHDFALMMFIGIFVGTYSSIFVASPALLLFGDTLIIQAGALNAEREAAAKRSRNRDLANGSV